MNYKEILLYGVYSDLRTEVARRFLGFLWWIIDPVLYMAAFYVVFALALRQGGTDYAPFLLIGMVVWKWFDSTVRQASVAIVGNAALIQQIYIPKSLLVLIQIFSNAFRFAIVLGLLLVFLLAIGKRPSLHWLALVPVILTQLYLVTAVGLLLSGIIPLAQDFKQVVDNLLMVMMFLSGIFFTSERMPEALRFAFELNPMVVLIQAFRSVLLHNQWPDFAHLLYVIMVATPLLVLAVLFIRKNERRYPKLML
ncbi:teichoic acid ABC transporter permease [Pseudomonas alcaligenes]|uniref:Transport permease protein n=1 Tax=Aquipseudomonas alcaligenes TaxID=43263 RepID=A0ABR7S8G0_AQUAC|nr:ABC transporter permease [Pseudomonas alcaligenes]MBC9252901.1 teichoic acid ABC transporter permease [Pseudomonas alcaligenes]